MFPDRPAAGAEVSLMPGNKRRCFSFLSSSFLDGAQDTDHSLKALSLRTLAGRLPRFGHRVSE